MVELVLDHIRVELGELVVHLSGQRVVLDVEIAVREQGKSGAVSWRELQLIREDSNHLQISKTIWLNQRCCKAFGGLTSVYFWSRRSE